MFISGGQEIQSTEGTTRGDPIGMAMCALAITPSVRQLHDKCTSTSQVWFADDASAAAKCCELRQCWDNLIFSLGPKYGYNTNGAVLPHCKGALC